MPRREFTDHRGHAWRVWDTRPSGDNVRPELDAGWLIFEREAVRKRLAPIPEGWAELPDDALRLLCATAPPDRRWRPRAE